MKLEMHGINQQKKKVESEAETNGTMVEQSSKVADHQQEMVDKSFK